MKNLLTGLFPSVFVFAVAIGVSIGYAADATQYSVDKTPVASYANMNAYVAAKGVNQTADDFIGGNGFKVIGKLTVPANIDLYSIRKGFKFIGNTGSGTDTLIISRMSARPMHQIFDTSLTVIFSAETVEYVKPEWFGGFASDFNSPQNVSTQVQKAVNSLPIGGVLKFLGGSNKNSAYYCSGISITRAMKMEGNDQGNTLIAAWDTSVNIFNVHSPDVNGTEGFTFQDLRIGSSRFGTFKHTGISLKNVVNSTFERVHVGTCNKGICVEQDPSVATPILNFSNCIIGSACSTGIAIDLQGDVNCRVTGCWFDENYKYGLYIAGGNVVVTGNNFQDNGSAHIYMTSAGKRTVITGNNFWGGGAPFGTSRAIVCYTDDNVIVGNSFDSSYTGGVQPIVLQTGADNNVVQGNVGPLNLITDAGTDNTVVYTRQKFTVHSDSVQYPLIFSGNITDATSKDLGSIVAKGGGIAAEKAIFAGTKLTGLTGLQIGSFTPQAAVDTTIVRISAPYSTPPYLTLGATGSGASPGAIAGGIRFGHDFTLGGGKKYATIEGRTGADSNNTVSLLFSASTSGGKKNVMHLWSNGGLALSVDSSTTKDPGASNLYVQGKTTSLNGVSIGATRFVYFGDSATTGTWRIGRDSDSLKFQRNESGTWITKQRMTP